MAKGIMRALLGLSIIASGVAIASPASAQTHMYSSKASTTATWCLAVQGTGDNNHNYANGTRLITWPCNPNNSDLTQQWAMQPYSGGSAQQLVSSVHSQGYGNECAALQNNGSTSDGTQAIIWPCAAATNDQGWWKNDSGKTDAWGHHCYSFTNEKALLRWPPAPNTKLLTVQGGTPNYSTNVVLWPINQTTGKPDDAQLWCEW